MALGGYRPGSGRKKKSSTIAKEMVKDYIAGRISKDIEPIVDKLIDKSVKGDVFAVKELFDRGFGKATATIGGDKDNPLLVEISEAIARKNDINPSTK